jgi:lauroyl/myristoyl acyltransferase
MLEFKKSIDPDGLKADLSDDTAVINVVVQIWIYTKPGDGLFEVRRF